MNVSCVQMCTQNTCPVIAGLFFEITYVIMKGPNKRSNLKCLRYISIIFASKKLLLGPNFVQVCAKDITYGTEYRLSGDASCWTSKTS